MLEGKDGTIWMAVGSRTDIEYISYEQVGFASVPDHYEDEDEEDSPPPKKKEDKEEQQHPEKKEDDLLEGGPLEL